MSVRVLKPDSFRNQIKLILNDFERLVCSDGLRIACTQDGSLIPALDPITSFKAFQARNGLEGMVYQILYDACFRSEHLGAGSTSPLIRFVTQAYEELVRTETDTEHFNFACNDYRNMLEHKIHRPSKDIVERMLKETMNDEDLLNILLKSIDLAGNECRIFVKKSPSNQTVIELTNGYIFEISPNKLFYRNDGWKEKNVRCLVVDGTIEKVSEIDRFLRLCNETKQTGAIFARGFGEEVIATLKVNFDRETLKIIPIIVGFSLETVNVLNDIAIVAGADMISSLKGQLISTVDPETLPSIRSLECVDRTVTIINSSTTDAVEMHVKNLQTSREETHVKDISDLLDKRIKSLSSSVVNIRVGSESAQRAHTSFETLDLGIRAVSNTLKSGIIDTNDLKDIETSALMQKCLKGVFDGRNLMPSTTIYATLIYGMSTLNTLMSTGIILSSS